MKTSLILALLLASTARAEVSVETRERRAIPLTVALVAESAKFWPAGFAPGFSVGTELPYRLRRGHALFQSFHLGYFHHADLEQALTIGTELGYRHTFRVGPFLELRLGAAYFHTFPVGDAYALEDGRYHRDDRGAPHFLASLAVGVGYDFSQLPRGRAIPLALFLRYQLGIETPGVLGVPAYPDTQILFGARIPFQTRTR